MDEQQLIADYQSFPYREAQDYNKLSSIVEAFPHLKEINKDEDWEKDDNISGVIIKSNNDDNVHKAIKYEIWTTTHKNREKLNDIFLSAQKEGKNIFLFFSTNKSGMFEGVAKLVSGELYDTFPYWWNDYQGRFKGYFRIEWIFIKDVNYYRFPNIFNPANKSIKSFKDCDIIDSTTTKEMLTVFSNKPMNGKWIFNDFRHMDTREKEIVRKNQNLNKRNYETSLVYEQNIISNSFNQALSFPLGNENETKMGFDLLMKPVYENENE